MKKVTLLLLLLMQLSIFSMNLEKQNYEPIKGNNQTKDTVIYITPINKPKENKLKKIFQDPKCKKMSIDCACITGTLTVTCFATVFGALFALKVTGSI